MRHLHSPQEAAQWLHTQVRGVLHTDSRRVTPGDGFIAWPGAASDGRRHVPAALKQGAAACLVERSGVEAFSDTFAVAATSSARPDLIASYTDLKAASGPIAAAYYEQPSQALDVLAITGTNGKTSTAWWLAHALGRVGQRCAVVGTLGVGELDQLEVTGMTTPDPVLLQARLRDMVTRGVQACAIEASSIGLAEHRLDGTQVRVALFTNFTQDHLDYHGTFEAYEAAKARLFAWPELRAAVINRDDAAGRRLLASTQGHARTIAYGLGDLQKDAPQADALLLASNVRATATGTAFHLSTSDWGNAEVEVQTLGAFNVSNLLGVLGALLAADVPFEAALAELAKLESVNGRMQRLGGRLQNDEPLVVIDYAHTPDALEKTLEALRPMATARGGELICMFGCGGDRDATKRPLMGAIAEKIADGVVVTSDNPRSEDPQSIIEQIAAGMKDASKARRIEDRASAILQAIRSAAREDVIVLAGKGHEATQEIMGKKRAFSDQDHARLALAARATHARGGGE